MIMGADADRAGSRGRIGEVDFFRGIAIIMMVIFHFMWSLVHLSVSDAELMSGFWRVFQTMTGGLFIFIAGVSLALRRSKLITSGRHGYTQKLMLRGFQIFCMGLLITFFSWLFMPDAVVFFGILHFIGVSIIIASFFAGFRWLNLLIGALSIALWLVISKIQLGFPWLVWLWLNHPVTTLDLYTMLPWISFMFIGMFIGNMAYPCGKRTVKIKINRTLFGITRPVQFLGRHSLCIYFLHLPAVFGAAYLISLVI